jgi:hypothetical protein
MVIKEVVIQDYIEEDVQDGCYAISLVTDPAIEMDYQLFSKDSKKDTFQLELTECFANDEKQIIKGVVMRANHPIYRNNADGLGNEGYVIFRKDVIKKIVEKYSLTDSFTLQHAVDVPQGKIKMLSSYIYRKGIDVGFTEEVEDGSWVASIKVEDKELWDVIKNEGLKGFSIEIFYSLNN